MKAKKLIILCDESMGEGVSGPYKTVNDAQIIQPELAPGPVKVWYSKELMHPFDIEKGWSINSPEELKKTHILLGSIKGTDPDTIYDVLQGENWSPDGQARELIRNLDLEHTSMSIGDCIEYPDGKVLMVGGIGFQNPITGEAE